MPNCPSACHTNQINVTASRGSFPPLPSPTSRNFPRSTERLRDYFLDKSNGRYHTSKMVLMVLILGEGDRGPGLSAWLPRPLV